MEKFYRKKNTEFDNETELVFQAIEWKDFNEVPAKDSESSDVEDEDMGFRTTVYNDEKYVIRVFGVNDQGESVCLNVKNFTPFFYVKVPDTWKKQDVSNFLNKLANKLVIKKNDTWVNCSTNIIRDSCILQKRYDFYGFTNKKEFKFLRITFDNSDAMRRAVNIIKAHNAGKDIKKKLRETCILPLYEANLDSIIRFGHIKNLNFAGWIKATNIVHNDYFDHVSSCQIEVDVDWKDVQYYEKTANAPILQASYDIETYSDDGSFPVPQKPANVITQIATAFKYYGQDSFYVKHIICLKTCSPITPKDDVPIILECYNTEEEVLLAWRRVISGMDPDILYQYNGDQFDGNYLYVRSGITKCRDEFLKLGKLKNVDSTLDVSSFSSSAYGSSAFKRLSMPGRINFDLLVYMKRGFIENSYKLDSIAEKYLGQNKHHVTAKMMFEYFAEGDPDKIKIIAEYCIQDTLLPQRLVDKLHVLQNQISMSNVTYVPIRYLSERGEQIKVFSQILKETRKQNFLVPTIDNYNKVKDENEEDSFTGATVLPPLKGAYFEPITVCDFASLYPSIIRAHNLCFSTIVMDQKYMDLEGVEYETIEWDDTIVVSKDKTKVVHHKYNYVKNTEGILPKLLAELTIARKNYKKLMSETNDPFLKEVYNKCQLAVKLSMNSVYGFLAAPMLCHKPIAATVTSVGRDMIEATKKYMEDNYDASVAVYGDSVTGDTPLLIRDPYTNQVSLKTIETLGNEMWESYREFKPFDTNRKNKLQCKTHYEIWTDRGWTKIKRVIKHSTDKKIFRVISEKGAVDVTEDHSLLDPCLNILKPKDCKIGTDLLHSYPSFRLNIRHQSSISPDRAYILGLFDSSLIEPMSSIDLILNCESDAKRSYFLGFCKNYSGVLYDTEEKIVGCRIKNKLNAARLYYLLVSLYKNVSIDIDILSNKEAVYRILIKKQNTRTTTNRIHCIYEIEKPFPGEYTTVYDLETEQGRFQAGVGETIVKNTDSVFIKFKTETSDEYKTYYDKLQVEGNVTEQQKEKLHELKTKCIQESIDLGKIAGKNASQDLFKYPIKLEYEKVYNPLLLLSKKRYIGKLYSENAEKPDKTDNKGVVLKRRDNFELLKKTYLTTINIAMEEGKAGAEKAIENIKTVIYSIINGDYKDLDDFIISKTLKDGYKNLNIPHLVLANKMRERDPGSAPNSNDRVPYVFIDINSKKKEPQYKKVEDPEYVLANNLPLDAEYYIKFMKTSLCEILSLFTHNPEAIFDDIVAEYRNSRW